MFEFGLYSRGQYSGSAGLQHSWHGSLAFISDGLFWALSPLRFFLFTTFIFFSFNLFDSIAHKTAWHRNVYRDLESQIRSEARLVVPCTELRYGPMDREMLVSYYCDRGAWSRSRSLTFSTFLFYYRTGSMDDNAV